MRLPVTVMRPSGKITRLRPSRTACTSRRAPKGCAGSSGMASTKRNARFTHQSVATWLSMAKTGVRSRMASATAASSQLTWVRAMIERGPASARWSEPTTSIR